MAIPGNFPIAAYTSPIKTAGLPAIPSFSLPSIAVIAPKALLGVVPHPPSIVISPGRLPDPTASENAAGFASAMDATDIAAVGALPRINPVTGV